jgi:hypothetical protein
MIVQTVSTKVVQLAWSLLLGMSVATGVYGAAILLPEFTSTGTLSQTTKAVSAFPMNVYISASGSTTIKYPASCVANPLVKVLGAAQSGTVVRLDYQNGKNPTGASADIGFVKSCGNAGGSGTSLFNDTCTGSGCVSSYTTGTAAWNSADFIKTTFNKDPGAGYTGRLKLSVQGRFGNH